MESRFKLVGLVKVLGCCVFTWRSEGFDAVQLIELRGHHCARCVGELESHRAAGAKLSLLDLRGADKEVSGPLRVVISGT